MSDPNEQQQHRRIGLQLLLDQQAISTATACIDDSPSASSPSTVSLHIELAGGEANAHFTAMHEDWQRVKDTTDNDAFYLGDVCGKHSDIKIGFNPHYWEISIEEDPYGIAKMVQMHGDGCPYWIKEFLAKETRKRKTKKEASSY